MLLNPNKLTRPYADDRSREIMRKTVAFFESKGKTRLKADDHDRVWYADFLEFVKRERIFATMLTPAGHGAPDARWDTWRICEFNEILAFYGLAYWYTYQVSVLGLGPIWMSDNAAVKARAAKALEQGAIFGFGLSEQAHGADLYATEMRLQPTGEGRYTARGEKYYIGNANQAAMVSTFARIGGDDGPFAFFAADSQHERFECLKNVVASQSYVGHYRLNDYPLTEADILSKGDAAWDAALNTVNIGKYNLGWASIGICTHAFYEAITHAAGRRLYGTAVSDFPHARRLLLDAWARLVAMKLVALRAADYMRSASREDRRYLLYNPVVKMKVTTQGERVIDHLWDVIAAKGFEKNTYFEMAARDIRALPKLEGTVHVNLALMVKCMPNYFLNPAEYAPIPQRADAADDAFLFAQGPTRGLGKIRFHAHGPAFADWDLPNVACFTAQTNALAALLTGATPDDAQRRDLEFLMALGELFVLVVYAQLALENARIYRMADDVVDQIFDVLVRDFSRAALELHDKPSTTAPQMACCLEMVRKPPQDAARDARVWGEHVSPLVGAYEMRP